MSVVLKLRRADGSRRKGRADRAEVSRGRSTSREGKKGAGKGRTLSGTGEWVLLVLVMVIAVIPRTRAWVWEGTVQSVEYHGRA